MRECQPEVVITDVEIPNMDGIELTKRIKAEYTADVIVLTGFAPKQAYAEFIRIGASDFIRKPVTPSEIIAALERILKERCLKAESMSAHQKLVAAHEALQASSLETIHRIVVVTECKDEKTSDPIVWIGRLCALLSDRLGLPDKEVDHVPPIHDSQL